MIPKDKKGGSRNLSIKNFKYNFVLKLFLRDFIISDTEDPNMKFCQRFILMIVTSD